MKTKICSKCEKTGPVSEFSKSKSSKDGFYQWCKSCTSIYMKDWHKRVGAGMAKTRREDNKDELKASRILRSTRSMEVYLRNCFNSRKGYDKSIGQDFDLDLPHVLDLLKAQGGKCALSGVKLTHGKRDPFAASIDRIDSSKGHVRGNVQIVCRFVNLGKANLSDEACREFIKAVKTGI